MKWKKEGLVYNSDGEYEWNKTHAQLPIVDIHHEDFWRIYYASRNKEGFSNISYIEVESGNPKKILYKHNKPILSFGRLGTFDESGLMPVAIITFENKKYLYYVGWCLKKTVPYHNSIGLAISTDNGETFKKFGEGPLFDINPFEPYSNGTMGILIENGIWKGWYQSIVKWESLNGCVESFYNIKYAESSDGILWERKAQVAIDLIEKTEAGICSASVLKDQNLYKMYYSFRKNGNFRNDIDFSYRIGYAESKNGILWERKDEESGIGISEKGWDSDMICYPNIVCFGKRKFMFYNGNGFGSSGFGYATSDSD